MVYPYYIVFKANMPSNCEGSCFSPKLLWQLFLLFPVNWDTNKCLMPQAYFNWKQICSMIETNWLALRGTISIKDVTLKVVKIWLLVIFRFSGMKNLIVYCINKLKCQGFHTIVRVLDANTCRAKVLSVKWSIVLRQGLTTTRFPSSTASTRMTLSYPNTSGTLRTATPISQSSGRFSCVQDLTGEPRHAVICAWWKSSAFYSWQINTSQQEIWVDN